MSPVAAPASRTRAPSFELPSTTGGSVGLDDLVSGGPALLIFASEECPTCALALRRLGPIVAPLRDAGVGLAVVFEDPLEVAARVARDARFKGTVLAEPAPYDTSRAYALESLPTTFLLDRDASVAGTVVGWDAGALSALVGQACGAVGAPAPEITDEPPRAKPGCAAKSTYDEEMLALIESAGAGDEMEDMFERGWTDGLPVVPPTRSRVDAMLGGRDPQAVARRGAARDGRGDARARRRVRGPRRLPPGVLPGRPRGGGGGARPGLQPQRAGGDDPARGPARDRQRSDPRGDRRAQRDGRARSRLAGEPDDRARAPAGGHADRRRRARDGWTDRRSGTPASSASASPRTRRAARGSRCTSSAGSRATTRS